MDATQKIVALEAFISKCDTIQMFDLDIDCAGDVRLDEFIDGGGIDLYIASLKMTAERARKNMIARLRLTGQDESVVPELPDIDVDMASVSVEDLMCAYVYLGSVLDPEEYKWMHPSEMLRASECHDSDLYDESNRFDVLEWDALGGQVVDWAKFLIDNLNERMPNEEWWLMDGNLCLAGYAVLSDCDDAVEWAEKYDEYANSLLREGHAYGNAPSMSYVSDSAVESMYAAMVEEASEHARSGMTDFVESWSQWRLAQNQHSKYEPLLGEDGGRDRLLECYRAAAKVVQTEVNRRF